VDDDALSGRESNVFFSEFWTRVIFQSSDLYYVDAGSVL